MHLASSPLLLLVAWCYSPSSPCRRSLQSWILPPLLYYYWSLDVTVHPVLVGDPFCCEYTWTDHRAMLRQSYQLGRPFLLVMTSVNKLQTKARNWWPIHIQPCLNVLTNQHVGYGIIMIGQGWFNAEYSFWLLWTNLDTIIKGRPCCAIGLNTYSMAQTVLNQLTWFPGSSVPVWRIQQFVTIPN